MVGIKKPHKPMAYEVVSGGPTVTRTRDQRIMSPFYLIQKNKSFCLIFIFNNNLFKYSQNYLCF